MTTEIGLIGLGVIILVFLFILSAIVAGLFFQLQKIQGGNNDGFGFDGVVAEDEGSGDEAEEEAEEESGHLV